MKYTAKDIKDFKEIVCPNCNNNPCSMKTESCPKLFNFALYHTKDGSCPETSAMLKSQKK